MKTQTSILLAFLLNLGFAILEFFGGILTGSVAILSDAIHDLGDAISIGISYFLEKKSHKQPDDTYSCGYARFSVMGSVITIMILLFGSILVIIGAIHRILTPTPISYDGMIIFAIFGVAMNLAAAIVTRGKGSLNQRAVNLHMLEDVLGWVVVLTGALVMRFSDFYLLDPLMSMGVALFILVHAVMHLKEVVELFLEKTPAGISLPAIKAQLLAIDGIQGVHHLHIWSMDGMTHYATLHIVTGADSHVIKSKVRACLEAHNITHVTVEVEHPDECCEHMICQVPLCTCSHHRHHHH